MTPASIGDWTMFAGLLAAVAAFGATGFRWVLAETQDERRAADNRVPIPRRPALSRAA